MNSNYIAIQCWTFNCFKDTSNNNNNDQNEASNDDSADEQDPDNGMTEDKEDQQPDSKPAFSQCKWKINPPKFWNQLIVPN